MCRRRFPVLPPNSGIIRKLFQDALFAASPRACIIVPAILAEKMNCLVDCFDSERFHAEIFHREFENIVGLLLRVSLLPIKVVMQDRGVSVFAVWSQKSEKDWRYA